MLTISFDPSSTHLSQIESWLRVERETTGEGFYVNWNIIARAFNDQRIYFLAVEGQAIAFLVWSRWDDEAEFAILEVKPEFRRMGYGRILAEETMRRFADDGVSLVFIECMSLESEHFWRRLGFVDDPSPVRSPYSSPKLRKQLQC